MTEKTHYGIHARLAAARDQFHDLLRSGEVQKSGRNDFLNSSYFELNDLVPPGLRCLHDNGLCATPVRSTGLEITMSVVEMDTGIDLIFGIPSSKAAIKGAHEIQGLGAALTYSRRYLWMLLMEAVDPDVIENTKPKETRKPSDPATSAQMDMLRDAYRKGKMSEAATKKLKDQLDSGKGFTIKEASALIESLKLEECNHEL